MSLVFSRTLRQLGLVAPLAVILSSAAQAQSSPGEAQFKTSCVACHGAGGVGIPGLAPALAGALDRHMASPQGKTYLLSVLIGGLAGPIESKGQKYNSAMPKLGLQDEQIANVLRHVTTELNKAPEGFTISAEDVAKVRAGNPQPGANHALRKAVLAP
jgi:mono/diheme cytochrome c family protein